MLKRVLSNSSVAKEVRSYTTVAVAAAKEQVPSSSSSKPYEAIPLAKGLPVVGSIFQLAKRKEDFHNYLTELNQEYGPVVRIKVPKNELVLISDPLDFQTVFYAKDSMRYAIELFRKYREERKKPLTLVTLNYNEDWKSQRNMVNVMMRPPLVESYLPRISTISDNLVQAIYKNLDSKGVSPNLQQLFYRFGLEAILAVLYGRKAGLLNAEKEDENMVNLINAVLDMFATGSKLQQGVLWKYFETPMLKKHYDAWDRMLDSGKKIHRDSLENPNRTNYFTDSIANAAEIMVDQANSKNISEEMRDVLNAEVISGAIDTTGNGVNAAMYALAKHPEIQERLYQEIKSIVPDKTQAITSQDVAKMPYLKDCIKEVFRLFPPVAQNGRVSSQPVVVSGYEVPAGKMFLMNFWASSRNPKYFVDPTAFNPDRYKAIDKNSIQNSMIAFSSLPFGFGPRMCVGSRIANAEMQAVLCKILLNFKLEYNGEYPAFVNRTINLFSPRSDDERVRFVPRK